MQQDFARFLAGRLRAKADQLDPPSRQPRPRPDARMTLQVVWRGVITHRWEVKVRGQIIEFEDVVSKQRTEVIDGVWTCILPDEVLEANYLRPLGKDWQPEDNDAA